MVAVDGSRCETAARLYQPDEIQRLLLDWHYPKQRELNETWVRAIVYWIVGGLWRNVQPMTVGVLRSTGHRFILNGYHRATAILRAGVPVVWEIRYQFFDSIEALDEHYLLEDGGRRRTRGDTLHAAGLGAVPVLGDWSEDVLPVTFMKRLGSAAAVIHYRFQQVQSRYHAAELSLMGNQHDWTREWLEEGRSAHALLRGRPKDMTGLDTRPALAVMLVTLRYQFDFAQAFWHEAAMADGLAHASPEAKLGRFVADKKRYKGGEALLSRKVACFWNAAFRGRPVREDPVVDAGKPILIEGTSYGGRADG